jgi:hypothetical protein
LLLTLLEVTLLAANCVCLLVLLLELCLAESLFNQAMPALLVLGQLVSVLEAVCLLLVRM